MLVSIITPCRNAAPLLRDTLESLYSQSALSDGRVELEHLICDGASTDGTEAIAAGYPASSFVSEPDAGMYDALAKGLSRARGDIVGYLNAGDIYHPRAFDVLADVFSNPGIDWVTGSGAVVNDRLQVIASWKPPRFRREFFETGTYLEGFPVVGVTQEATFWSGALNRRVDLERLRGYRLAGDYDLWLQMSAMCSLHSIETLLGFFRMHSGQLSEDRDGYVREIQPRLRRATFRERLTAFWEFRCPGHWKRHLSRFVLPKSPSSIFRYDCKTEGWVAS